MTRVSDVLGIERTHLYIRKAYRQLWVWISLRIAQ